MRTYGPDVRVVTASAQIRADGFKDHILFKVIVFTLSVAGGYYFSRWLYIVLPALPFWTTVAHEKASPAVDAFRTLHSGFTN
jgi:hypothetical protein